MTIGFTLLFHIWIGISKKKKNVSWWCFLLGWSRLNRTQQIINNFMFFFISIHLVFLLKKLINQTKRDFFLLIRVFLIGFCSILIQKNFYYFVCLKSNKRFCDCAVIIKIYFKRFCFLVFWKISYNFASCWKGILLYKLDLLTVNFYYKSKICKF